MKARVMIETEGPVQMGDKVVTAGDYVMEFDVVREYCPVCSDKVITFKANEIAEAEKVISTPLTKALIAEVEFVPESKLRLAKVTRQGRIVSRLYGKSSAGLVLIFYEGELRRVRIDDCPELTEVSSGWIFENKRDGYFLYLDGRIIPPNTEIPEVVRIHNSCKVRQGLAKPDVVMKGRIGCSSFAIVDNFEPVFDYFLETLAQELKVDKAIAVWREYYTWIPRKAIPRRLRRLRAAGYDLRINAENEDNIITWRIEPAPRDG